MRWRDFRASASEHDNLPPSEGSRISTAKPWADENLDVGHETRTAVAPECDVKSSEFTAEINWVELKVGGDDHSHLADPEDIIHVLMTRQ